jgi:hypothetical protein
MVVAVKKGMNSFAVSFRGPGRALRSMDLELAGRVRGKTWLRDGKSMSYLWPVEPQGATLVFDVPETEVYTIYVSPRGERQVLTPGKHKVHLPFQEWMRVEGPDRAMLQRTLQVRRDQ